MNPTGSFGAPAGGISAELQQAIQSRQGGATSAVTQGAPTFDPTTQPAQPPTAQVPGMTPSVGGTPAPTAETPEPTTPFNSVEAKMILGALAARLKAGSDFFTKVPGGM